MIKSAGLLYLQWQAKNCIPVHYSIEEAYIQKTKKTVSMLACRLPTFTLVFFADPFSEPDMEKRPNEDSFAKAATITVAIVGVGGSAVAGTAYALYKEVIVAFKSFPLI